MGSVGNNAERMGIRLVRWGDARRALDDAFGKLRARVDIELPASADEGIIRDIPNVKIVRAFAFKKLCELWYGAAAVLTVIRLPKKGRKRKTDRAFTVNPEGKIMARNSRQRLIGRLGKAQARRHGKTTHHARRRSHHPGVYSKLKAGPGRPVKYRTKEQAKHAHRLAVRKAWRKTGKRRAYSPRRTPAQVKQMKEWKKTHADAWKAALKDWQALPKKRHADDRPNHRSDYGYNAPQPRLRRTAEQVKRWGRRKETTEAKRDARRAYVSDAKGRRRPLELIRKGVVLAGIGERRRMEDLRQGYARFKAFMTAKITIAMGTAHGRQWGARNRKKTGL